MNPQSPLFDTVSHTIWADRQLLGFLRTQDDTTLNTATGGTYGSIMDTFRHLIASELSYLTRYAYGQRPEPWETYDSSDLDELASRVDEIEGLWTEILDHPLDNDGLGEARGDDGEWAVRKGVFLAQAIHHSNEHRAQICSTLGLLGIEPPEVSAWLYAIQTGRQWPVSPEPSSP